MPYFIKKKLVNSLLTAAIVCLFLNTGAFSGVTMSLWNAPSEAQLQADTEDLGIEPLFVRGISDTI